MDEKQRYAVYRVNNGRCHYCGTRLIWEAFETRGRSGAWVLEDAKEGDPASKPQALCYKCFEFEGRGKSARRLVVMEPASSAGADALAEQQAAERAKDAEKAQAAESASPTAGVGVSVKSE